MMHQNKTTLPETGEKDFYVNISAATMSAALDSLIFHPFETAVRRVQLGENILPHASWQLKCLPVNLHSLFQGMLLTNVLKAASRSFRYAGEPLIAGQLKAQLPDYNPVLLHSLAGAATGTMAAICLTPLDTLKVQKQRSHNRLVSYPQLATQTVHYWHAGTITVIRNSFGTGAFFACNSFLRHYVFRLGDDEALTTRQKLINSVLSPTVGILVSYPADLIKTHIQAAETNAPGIRETAAQLTAKDGLAILYRGLLPKLLTMAPRAAVSYFLYQSLQERFRLYADHAKYRPTFFKLIRQDVTAGAKPAHTVSAPDLRK